MAASLGSSVGTKAGVLYGPCRIFITPSGGSRTELGYQTLSEARWSYTNAPNLAAINDRGAPIIAMESTESAKISFEMAESTVAQLLLVTSAHSSTGATNISFGTQAINECKVELEGMSVDRTKVTRVTMFRAINMATISLGFQRGAERKITGIEFDGLADPTINPTTQGGDLLNVDEDASPSA